MLIDSRTSYHFGVNYIIAPPPLIDGKQFRKFQEMLAGEGLEFTGANHAPSQFAVFQRGPAAPLEVRVQQPAPPVGQLLIIAPKPARTLDDFIEEAEAACKAYSATWTAPIQVVARDCTIRHLYDVAAEQSFQYIWVQRLGQAATQMDAFQRPVLGGGLRFIMPQLPDEEDARQTEVKIETFFEDSRKLFVEVSFAWQAPSPPNTPPNPRAMLEKVEQYATNEVVSFITGGTV